MGPSPLRQCWCRPRVPAPPGPCTLPIKRKTCRVRQGYAVLHALLGQPFRLCCAMLPPPLVHPHIPARPTARLRVDVWSGTTAMELLPTQYRLRSRLSVRIRFHKHGASACSGRKARCKCLPWAEPPSSHLTMVCAYMKGVDIVADVVLYKILWQYDVA